MRLNCNCSWTWGGVALSANSITQRDGKKMIMRKIATLASISVFTAAAAQAAETVKIAMHYTEEQAAPLLACIARYEAANPDTDIVYQQIS